MPAIALIAEFTVHPEHRDAFVSLMRSHAATALREEDGCTQFDVVTQRDEPNRVFLYEIYGNDAALREHMESPQLARTRGDYAHMIVTKRVTICERQ